MGTSEKEKMDIASTMQVILGNSLLLSAKAGCIGMSMGKSAASPVKIISPISGVCALNSFLGGLKGLLQLVLVGLQNSVLQRISVSFCVYHKYRY